MSNDLTTTHGRELNLSKEDLTLITTTIAKGATPEELRLFLARCKLMNLNPLKPGQIHFVKYGTGPGSIVVGIEGFRSLAARTGMMNGTKRGCLKDDKGNLLGGWAEVYRKDWQFPARAEVSFAEYTTGRGPWSKMPESMIQKVAEVAALRMAFPDDLGGIYAQEEMHQADAEQARKLEHAGRLGLETLPSIKPEEPPEGEGFQDDEYKIPFGQWKHRSCEEVLRVFGKERAASYIEFLEATAEKKGKPLGPEAVEFIEHMSRAIAEMENGRPEVSEDDVP
jgi:phage recombination protein Bet